LKIINPVIPAILTVHPRRPDPKPKLVLRVWQKISQMPHNLSAQFVCLSPKVLDFNGNEFEENN
jgi:hypothetical protein